MLLDEIIDGLTDDSSDLVDALLKTKRLLHEIGRKELSEWINYELSGYPEGIDVPTYRTVPAQVRGDLAWTTIHSKDQPIPATHPSADQRAKFGRPIMRDSISVIQEFSAKERHRQPIPKEVNSASDIGLSKDVRVICAWWEIAPAQLRSILTQVRSRLLDFLLDLRALFPEVTSNADLILKTKSADIASMFNNAVFGPGTNIFVGDHNRQTIANGVQPGDFQSLIAALTDLRVPTKEIEGLKAVVDDNPSDEEGTVMRWLKSAGGEIASSAVKACVLGYLGLS